MKWGIAKLIIILFVGTGLLAAEPVFQIRSPKGGESLLDQKYGLITVDLYLEVSQPVSSVDNVLLDQFRDNQFKILVNGVVKPCVWRGGGNGSTADTVTQHKDMAFSPGFEAGTKKIEVVLGDLRREVTIEYQPVTHIAPIGLCNNLALFKTDQTCSFVVTNVKPSRIMAMVNGEPIPASLQEFKGNDNLVQVQVQATRCFKRGRNQILIMVTDRNDQDSDCTLALYYYPVSPGKNDDPNQKASEPASALATMASDLFKSQEYSLLSERLIPLGDEFLVEYGYTGGKSGPWFGCSTEGEAIQLVEYLKEDVTLWQVDAFGMVIPDSPQLAKVKAVKLGAGRILIHETPHFTQPEQLKKEIPVTVYDPNNPQTAAAWEDFVADANAFSCKLPAPWHKEVSHEDDVDRVYGVISFAERTWEGLVPYVQVEYFPKGNLLHETPRHFFAAYLDPRFLQDGETHSAISVITVNGKKCWYFEKQELEYPLPRQIDPEGVMAAKKFIVVPETDNSFYVLQLCTPVDNVGYYQPFFDIMVNSFKPQTLK